MIKMNIDSIIKNKNIFFKYLEKELEISFESLNENLENNENWDSLAKMTFVATLDKQFKIKINPKDLLKVKKKIDLYNLVLKASK
jgi:acyl carrier protein